MRNSNAWHVAKTFHILLFLFFMTTSFVVFSQKVVTGTVKHENDPLARATVSVKGTNVATTTGNDGSFSINVPQGSTILVISYVDYETQEVNVANVSQVEVRMLPSTSTLNMVVVTGYSSQRKKDITGAVTVVNVNELKSQPSADATGQLQGRASGVTVVTTGIPGSSSKVRIRGLGSFNNNSPLYVVDGVQTFSINGLNPNDIESMQVLKDAASASVYGVRGSNGVVIITTKKAKRRGTSVNYNMYYGVQSPGKGFDMLNAQEEAELYFLARRNSGQPTTGSVFGNGANPVLPDYIYYTGAPNNGVPIMNGNPNVNPALYHVDYARLGDNYTPYIIVPTSKNGTNWYDVATRSAPIQNHNIALATSNENSRALLSLDYFNQQAITEYQFYKRYTARLNTEFSFLQNAVRVGENIQAFYSSQNVPFNRNPNDAGAQDQDNGREASAIAQTFRPSAIIPVYTIREGDFAGTAGGSGFGTWGNAKNPLAGLYRNRNNRTNMTNIFGNIYAEVDFARHFTARTSFGGSLNSSTEFRYPFIEYEHVENTANTTYNENFIRNDSWIWTNQLTFRRAFGEHDVMAIVGTEAQHGGGRQIITGSQGFFIYSYQPFINPGNGGVQNLSDSRAFTPVRTQSYFAKADYSFKKKYLLSATVRRDGSSKFLGDLRWGTFPAFSLGWRISDEVFMQPTRNWLNDLKIRGSWGKMGNEAAATAQNAFTTFGSNRQSSWYDISGSQNAPLDGFTLTLLGNIFGQWEENVTTNIGFDATLFNNTTEVVFDWYQKKTDKLLFNPEVEGIRGSQRPAFQNVAGMKNSGIDVMITHRRNIGRALRFNSTLTFTTYKNEITSIGPGLTFFDFNSPANEANRIGGNATRNYVGSALNTFYGYKVIGLFQSAADVTGSPTQAGAGPGRFKYADVNGDRIIDAGDRTIIGDPNPSFTYGLNLGLEYKDFDFTAFFYGVAGRDAFNTVRWWTDFSSGFPGGRSKRALYDSWLPDGSRPNAGTPIQETTTVQSGFSTSGVINSYYVEDASYFRLRNLQIGYTLPGTLSNKARISKARIYIQGTNLFTITKYTGLDPEVVVNDDRAAGIDVGAYPLVRQFLVGVNVTF